MNEDFEYLRDRIQDALLVAVDSNLPEGVTSGERMVIRHRALDRFERRIEKLAWEMRFHMARVVDGRG